MYPGGYSEFSFPAVSPPLSLDILMTLSISDDIIAYKRQRYKVQIWCSLPLYKSTYSSCLSLLIGTVGILYNSEVSQ